MSKEKSPEMEAVCAIDKIESTKTAEAAAVAKVKARFSKQAEGEAVAKVKARFANKRSAIVHSLSEKGADKYSKLTAKQI